MELALDGIWRILILGIGMITTLLAYLISVQIDRSVPATKIGFVVHTIIIWLVGFTGGVVFLSLMVNWIEL